MGERTMRIQELSGIYCDISQELTAHSLPEWLQLDLTFQQMKVLYILKQKGPLKMRELSLQLGVTMPTITGIINRMVNRRDGAPLLTRSVSPDDRREVWAHLTKAGVEATEMLTRINQTTLSAALNQLSEADLESLHGPLMRLNEAVQEQIRASTPAPEEPLPLNTVTNSLLTEVAVN